MVTQVTATLADIHTWDNLYLAYRKAAKGKRSRRAAAAFEYHLEDNLIDLQDDLAAGTYTPGAYASFTIHEPKRRLISAAPFRDRVVHHALCNLIEPAFERSFIHHCYANRIGKGTHRALDTCQAWAKRYPYVLQCDVRQFFPSIDHGILEQTLQRRIQDPGIRRLIALIVASGRGVLSEEYDMVYFRGFDHFVARDLGCPAFLRFVDDFLLFGNDKRQLLRWKAAIIARLGELRLTIHEDRAHVHPVTHGIPFLGFVVYPTHRLLKGRQAVNYRRHLHEQLAAYRRGKLRRERVGDSIMGWINHVRYGDTWGLRNALLRDVRL